ncbi:MAG: replication-relaxation family protein [Anaerolineae bacterium]
MTRLTQEDVKAVGDKLTPTQREVLELLSWLPLAPADVLTRLMGLNGPAEVYRVIGRLEALGLIGRLQPPLEVGHNPRLAYLTGLGVAVVALECETDPVAFARARRLRQGELLRQLPRLPHDLALYRLLAALAASGSEPPTLAGWQAPRGLSYQRRSEAVVTVRAPAWACLRWGKVELACLLIADLGGFPLRRYRGLLACLVEWRHVQGGVLPLLVVGTVSDGRAVTWRQLLVEVGRSQRDSPVEGCVVTWAQVERGEVEIGNVRGQPCDAKLAPVPAKDQVSGQNSGKTWNLRSLEPALRVEKLAAKNQLPALALTLTPMDRELLDVVARHPFLSPPDLAEIMDWTTPWARRQCDRLVALGALRRLVADEVGKKAAAGGWLEVTRVALRLLAEQRGMTLTEATHWLGYAGGGPDGAVGVRRKLVQVLGHTLGVNGVFVGLYRAARRARAEGRDERLLVWRSGAQCGQGMIRPDGYGVYAFAGNKHSFWLEYDRGTMWQQALRAKFEAYAEYYERRLYRRDYAHMPALLIITQRASEEAHILAAIRDVAMGDDPGFTIRLTNEIAINDLNNTEGLRGLVWRHVGRGKHERGQWP